MMDILPLYHKDPLGFFFLRNARKSVETYAIWIAVGLIILVFAYSATQTISTRVTNSILDALVAALKNPYVLGGVVGIVVVTAISLTANVILLEGDHVVCAQDKSRVYRYTKSQLRHYPNPDIARSWGAIYVSLTDNNYKTIPKAQCDRLPKGRPMELLLVDGDHIACQDNPGKVYRYEKNILRHYPSPEIARAWGSEWKSVRNNNHKILSAQVCNNIPKGSPMRMPLVEGDHVACDDNPGKVYRYTSGVLRHYPSPEIARSWGSVWKSAKDNNHKLVPASQCAQIPRGSPMGLFV